MTERMQWTSRKFALGIPPEWMPNVIERLHGTGVRLEAISEGLHDSVLCAQLAGAWSLKQHIGHLIDLEALHLGRVEDFRNDAATLRPADMSNAATQSANHNAKPLAGLLAEFQQERARLVEALLGLGTNRQSMSVQHPRLDVPMRPVDLAFFVAEHDDHHLATMRGLLP